MDDSIRTKPDSYALAGARAHTRERTAAQLERQAKVYDYHVAGASVRKIAAKLRIDKSTVMRDIAEERRLRVKAAGEDAEVYRVDAIAFYETIKRRSIRASDDSRWVSEAVKAQTRIDRIRGIDQPVKVDAGLEGLLKALDAD
jgi:FixJ family two-component response regulator